MTPLRTDSSLYTLEKGNTLKGLSVTYVNDLIRARTKTFRRICEITHERLEITDYRELPISSSDFQLEKKENGFMIHQSTYTDSLKPVPTDTDCFSFRSTRIKVACLSHTWPDVLYEVLQATQVTEEMFSKGKIVLIKRLQTQSNTFLKTELQLKCNVSIGQSFK